MKCRSPGEQPLRPHRAAKSRSPSSPILRLSASAAPRGQPSSEVPISGTYAPADARTASAPRRRARARQNCAPDCPSGPRRHTDGAPIAKRIPRQLRPCFDKIIIRAKSESRSNFLKQDESIFEAKLRWSAVLERSGLLCRCCPRIFASQRFICKYLITNDLRLGSSVGRAED
jgi:hypothetical protein